MCHFHPVEMWNLHATHFHSPMTSGPARLSCSQSLAAVSSFAHRATQQAQRPWPWRRSGGLLAFQCKFQGQQLNKSSPTTLLRLFRFPTKHAAGRRHARVFISAGSSLSLRLLPSSSIVTHHQQLAVILRERALAIVRRRAGDHVVVLGEAAAGVAAGARGEDPVGALLHRA